MGISSVNLKTDAHFINSYHEYKKKFNFILYSLNIKLIKILYNLINKQQWRRQSKTEFIGLRMMVR
jgi:hypothetical protein